ncbi:hypothetical protein REPUB_Repub18cG0030600 [Reevesia pubescens]
MWMVSPLGNQGQLELGACYVMLVELFYSFSLFLLLPWSLIVLSILQLEMLFSFFNF